MKTSGRARVGPADSVAVRHQGWTLGRAAGEQAGGGVDGYFRFFAVGGGGRVSGAILASGMPPSSKVYSYTVVFETMREGGYNVLVPAIPEICTFGETREEARDRAEDAIRLLSRERASHGRTNPRRCGTCDGTSSCDLTDGFLQFCADGRRGV